METFVKVSIVRPKFENDGFSWELLKKFPNPKTLGINRKYCGLCCVTRLPISLADGRQGRSVLSLRFYFRYLQGGFLQKSPFDPKNFRNKPQALRFMLCYAATNQPCRWSSRLIGIKFEVLFLIFTRGIFAKIPL